MLGAAVKPLLQRGRFVQVGLIVMLAALLTVAALPNYISGQWPWSSPLKAPTVEQLQALLEEPLVLPGWEEALHQQTRIGGNRWSVAEYRPDADNTTDKVTNFAVLLRPQPWHTNQPQVEWVDLVGNRRWQVNDLQTLRFTVVDDQQTSIPITARYFRALDNQSTFAVMQWYAWSTGGHPAPGRWFWADQLRQWTSRERMPWVAVSLLIPIEPVGNIRPYSEEAMGIGQLIQTSLRQAVFQGV